MNLIEAIVLGIVQGIAEWVPISSEGLTVLIGVRFFENITLTELIRLSLFLHLGTLLAALVYFKRDVIHLLKELFNYKKTDPTTRKLLNFYLIATVASGGLGAVILKAIEGFEGYVDLTAKSIVVLLGILLFVTGLAQLRRSAGGYKSPKDLKLSDGLALGVAQGISVLPGLSRSGLTVSTLLLRGFDDTHSLKLSFIMSLPIVLVGNILLNTSEFALTLTSLVSLLFAFAFGLLAIHLLLKIAQRVKFGWFVLLFSFLVIGSIFI
ncbi:MAG: hypothetical protein A2Y84_01400 [Candidatus Colwellbacteria bacterium RBG_13_48_8]|uniref:Undecaprenyl-diphosphatase n=1 Tax=Candidatus Colwellbacteria bacterium RBG_13_48_8 TaxID=1797685 RepID=A0A1G1YYK8_9BACT|nr:MAG: hypothetical protein A2Y84_01400 [Candidatus Colwellbacteria bacterium RBG_13_48_8]